MLSYKVVNPAIYLKETKFIKLSVHQGGGEVQDLSK